MKKLIPVVVAFWAASHGGGAFSALELSAAEVSGVPQALRDTPPQVTTESVMRALQQRDQPVLEQLGPTAYDALVAALTDESVRPDAVFYLGQLRDPRAVVHFLALTNDPSPSVRGSVAHALAGFPDAQARHALMVLLDDSERLVRSSAATGVGQMRDPQAFDLLVGLLKHHDDEVRRSAVRALGSLGDQRAVEPLIAVLEDPYPMIRGGAASALQQLGWKPTTDRLRALDLLAFAQYDQTAQLGPAAVGPLLAVLKSTSGFDRRKAAETLTRMGWQPENDSQRAYYLAALGRWPEVAALGAKAAVEPLLLEMSSPVFSVDLRTGRPSVSGSAPQRASQSALEALKSLGNSAIPPLCSALQSPNRGIRQVAPRMLGTFKGDAQVVEPLIQALNDPDSTTRAAVVGALGALRDPRGLESLTAALKDRDAGTRRQAADALGTLGDPRAIAPLIETLKDRNPDVRWSAGYALQRLKLQGSVEQMVNRLSDSDTLTRAVVAEVLARMRDARAIEAAIGLLDDPSPEVRRTAVATLGSLRDSRAVPALIGGLQDLDERVRSSAAIGLARQRDAAAFEPLLTALRVEDKETRGAVASALARLGDKRAVEPLRAALKNQDGSDNFAVAYALAELKDASAVAPLIAALENPDSEWTGMGVVGVLMQMGPAAVEPLLPLLKHEDPKLRCLAAGLLSKIPDPRLVVPLMAALHDPEAGVVQCAASGLVLLDDPRAAAPLAALLKDPMSLRLQQRGGADPAKAEPSPSTPAANSIKAATLLRWLDDASQPGWQPIAVWLCGRLGVTQAADRVFGFLTQAGPDQLLVAQALVRLKDPRGTGPLLESVRHAAAELDRPSLEETLAAPVPIGQAKPGGAAPPVEAAKSPVAGEEDTKASTPTERTRNVEDLEWEMARGMETLASLGSPAFDPLVGALKDQQPRMRVFAANTLGRLGDPRAVAALAAALKDPDERVRTAAEEALRRQKVRTDAAFESQQRNAGAEALLPTLQDGPEDPAPVASAEASPQDAGQPSDPLKTQCQQNLRELYAGIEAYKKIHGDLPNWLSDLVPQHVSRTNVFVCPTQIDTIATYPGLEDPRIRTSYTYDFCSREVPNTVWGGSRATMKDWKNRQRKLYGDAVPMIRCTHHDRVLNISYGGELFESSVSWEGDERFQKLSAGKEQGPGP